MIKQLDGYQVSVKGKTLTLSPSGKVIVALSQAGYGLLSIITDPNVTYILIAGIYGILFELYSQGSFSGHLRVYLYYPCQLWFYLLPINYQDSFIILGLS